MGLIDELLGHNETYARGFDKADISSRPARKLAVLACMDARMDLHRILGLVEGDAHVIRNAGGTPTDDAMRSLTISHRLLGTQHVILVHHTDCGMMSFTDADLDAQIEQDVGVRPAFEWGAFSDLEESVRQSVAAITESPLVSFASVRGFIYDVGTGRLDEVEARH